MEILRIATFVLSFTAAVNAIPSSQPFKKVLGARQSSGGNALTVDLGYGVYQGSSNSTTGINNWRGIRFAAPPTGLLRWQRPEAPSINRTTVQASNYGPVCNQIGNSMPASSRPSIAPIPAASEDCLFLNVQSPANATNLPVLVWIHGGGYGAGNGRLDFSDLLTTNGNNFVVVSIQYRLGAFGFLASDEVYKKGAVNAGLLDQVFALEWVQTYIAGFGGNPSAVTISGESAGGGSVMLMDMAYGGSLGDSLFQQAIAASPYLPKQYEYNAWVPSQGYYAFAAAAGCTVTGYGNASQTLFACLQSKDMATLQNATMAVTSAAPYGTWAFLPVTDHVLVQSLPSSQLLEKRVNGRNLLVGNNANEGTYFVPQTIASESDLLSWLQNLLPEFSDDDLAKVLIYYPISNTANSTRFATAGDMGASALDTSSLATGQQQRVNNIYAELTFVCPSYWMAEAYSGQDRTSYRYQYSALPGLHADDVASYFGPLGQSPYVSVDFQRAFMKIWGNFITTSNPSISNEVAAGLSSNATAGTNAALQWPAYSISSPYQLNLNQSGGTFESSSTPLPIQFLSGPTLRNNFTLANAYTWEAGRGTRCDFWRSLGPVIPA